MIWNFAVNDINLALGNGALSVSNAQGVLLVSSAGVTGSVSATLNPSLSPFSGNLGLTFGGGTVQVTASNVSLVIGDNTLTGNMTVTESNSVLYLSADDLTASLAGRLVTIEPPTGGTTVADTLEDLQRPDRRQLRRAGERGGSEIGASFNGIVTVAVAPGTIAATGTGDTLTIGGSNISANFDLHESASQLHLNVSNVSFSIGSSLSVSGAAGDLIVSASGVTGSASGTVNSSIANLTGSFGVAFAPGLIQLSGTADRLTYGDQSLAGSFTFTKNSTGTTLTSSNLTASLGGGLVAVTNGSGTLAVSAAGAITGSFSGTVSAGTAMTSGGAGFSGTVAVSVGSGTVTASGINDTLTIAGRHSRQLQLLRKCGRFRTATERRQLLDRQPAVGDRRERNTDG